MAQHGADTARQRAILEFIKDYKRIMTAVEEPTVYSGSHTARQRRVSRSAANAGQFKKLLLTFQSK